MTFVLDDPTTEIVDKIGKDLKITREQVLARAIVLIKTANDARLDGGGILVQHGNGNRDRILIDK